MAMIFPGMDPYLEIPALWSGLHTRLIVYVCDALQPLLKPRYVAAIEERVYLEEQKEVRVPDVLVKRSQRGNGNVALAEADAPVIVQVPELEIHERYVNILDLQAKQRIVTSIELISPSNKNEGPGRDSYVNKQEEIRHSEVHLVEIDLLRKGKHVLAVSEDGARAQGPYAYLACVNRARDSRGEFELYPRRLPQRLPRIAIPLTGKDRDVVLDVQKVIEQAYEAGSYADRLDYRRPCNPPLSKADQAWANQQIKIALGKKRNGKNNGRR